MLWGHNYPKILVQKKSPLWGQLQIRQTVSFDTTVKCVNKSTTF